MQERGMMARQWKQDQVMREKWLMRIIAKVLVFSPPFFAPISPKDRRRTVLLIKGDGMRSL